MFENAHKAGAVVRKVDDREFEGKPARAIILARRFDTDIDDVWDAITSAERLPRWFLPVTGDLEPGGRFQLEGNAGGTITDCDPPRYLAVTWEFGGSTSWVLLRLSEEADGQTLLELEHVGHLDQSFLDFWDEYGSGAGGVGWDLGILGLAEHLATGTAVDHKAGEQWPLSEEGRRYVDECSQAWARASIAAGQDEKAALKAAERTTAFYTEAPHTD